MIRDATQIPKKILEFFKSYIELDTSLESGKHYSEAVKLLQAEVEDMGFETQVVEIPEEVAGGKNRINLIARRFSKGNLPIFLIYNHVDVVAGNYQDAFQFSIRGGRAYGRGSSDMKGATVGVLAGLESLQGKALRFNLIFIATTDEETDQLGQLRYITPRLELPENTIVFDPDTFAGGVTIAHLGVFQMKIEIRGKSAHSGMSNLGKNAVEDAGKLMDFFRGVKEEYEATRSKYKTFKSLGIDRVCSRCNVNQIQGGTAMNVVPDSCMVNVDCRYIPEAEVEEEKEELLRRMVEFCDKENIEYELVDSLLIEGYATEHPEARKLDGVYKKISGESGLFGVMGSTSVSHWAKELGLPHFGVGVARANTNVHGVGEFVYLKDIENLSRTLEKFLAS